MSLEGPTVFRGGSVIGDELDGALNEVVALALELVFVALLPGVGAPAVRIVLRRRGG